MQQPVTIKGAVSTGLNFQIMPNSGKPNCKFDLSVQGTHPTLGIPQEIQVHIVTWNELAENVFNHVLKGNSLEITGRWDTREYTDKNGNLRNWTDFVAFKVVRGGLELRDTGFVRTEDSFIPEPVVDQSADLTPEWEGETNGATGTGQVETSDTPSAS